eukprot:Skav200976  [mRNA]  locus=scaffold448:830747:832822:- [translate_table: standard]
MLMFMATTFITLVPWIIYGGREQCQVSRGSSKTPWNQGFEDHWLDLSFRLIFAWLLVVHAIYVVVGDHPPSAHVRQSVRCVAFIWIGKLLHIVTIISDACQVPEYDENALRPEDADIVYFTVFGIATHYVGDVWFLQLVVERLTAFQAAYGEALPFTCASVWLSRLLILMVTMQLFGVVSRWTALLVASTVSVGVVVLSTMICIAYAAPYKYLVKARKTAGNDTLSAEIKKEMAFAMHLIHKSQIGTVFGCLGMVLAFMSFGLDFFVLPRDGTFSMIYVVASNLDSLAICACLVMLSGVNFKWCKCCHKLKMLPPSSEAISGKDLKYFSQKSWNFGTCRVSNPQQGEAATEWQQKVADLAMRRVSVEVLLEFYLQLGSERTMPHFDPKQSTTNDVVRHVVIPHSRDGQHGRSFAEKFGPSKPSMTPRMVTHHWSNRFCDLIAAVLADALGQKRWDLIAERLRDGGEDLREQLYAHGSLQWQYWICAFCINQHASICGSSMGVKDTVTGEVLPSCDCETPKFLNDQPTQCELNKFDDMMAYMLEACPKFLQVVAIDLHFVIFSRAWCVAELVQADASHLEQHMIIHSPGALERNSSQLKSIEVQNCSASRTEDKLAILAKIGGEDDVEKFNQRLQQILLGHGGLLVNWLDGQKLLQEVGAICARAKARVEGSIPSESEVPTSLEKSDSAPDP